ncbi:MAG: GNAT family N-acetyltransferase [Planctomycetia bacterium]|nr:GNAT family N-acetyltransferase [Planctomycetia bacterium]
MPNLTLRLIRDLAELKRLEPAWHAIAGGVPFREPAWLLTWWKHYGPRDAADRVRRELFVIAVEAASIDGEEAERELVGLAPFFVECSPIAGRVVRFLGSGEVCSDHLTLLAHEDFAKEVAAAVGEFLCTTLCESPLHRETGEHWDRIELNGAHGDDPMIAALLVEMHRHGTRIERRRGTGPWQLSLPNGYEAYLATLSKSHRKQLRRLARNVLDTDRARWHTVRTTADLEIAWPIFVDLHQRRRQSLGDAGSFRSKRFATFHEEATRRMLACGRLRMHWLELDGKPAAAEYHLVGDDAVYAYQAGLDPDQIGQEPGRLAGIAIIRQAIDDGFATYDLLRGDEPYKAHWRAVPLPTEYVSIIAPRWSSWMRYIAHRIPRYLRVRLLELFSRRAVERDGSYPGAKTQADHDAADELEYATAE